MIVRLPVVRYRGNGGEGKKAIYVAIITVEGRMRTYSLYDVFVRNDNVSSDGVALVEGEETFTFHELHMHVLHAAAVLKDKGVGAGDRVAMLSLNNSGFFILLGALARLGAIMVPLNWRLSAAELSYIVKDSLPVFLFTDQEHAQKTNEIIKNTSISVLNVEDLTTWDKKQPSKNKASTYDDKSTDSDMPLCIIYTAAVEGYPRGAVLSHGNLIAANMQVITSMGLSAKDANLNMLPLFHITGLNLALAVMQAGGRNVIVEKFDEIQVLEVTTAEKITLWGSFPPILNRIMTQLQKGAYDISSLKYVAGLDGPDTIASFEKKVRAKFWILYGQSETTGFVTFSKASEKPGSAGKQGCLTTFCLLGDDDNQVKPDEIGEIAVRGPLVFQGYWQQKEATEKTFRNGWHHTGDLGQLDSEGYLFFKGRKPEKELIKPGGENVYPAEVEAAILEHSAVKEVCVIGVPDAKFGEGIKAVCVLHGGEILDKKELIEFVAGRIARYKKPKYVEFVDALPRRDEKIDRPRVKELWG